MAIAQMIGKKKTPEKPSEAPPVRRKKKKPSERLATVLSETAPAAAVELMRNNEPFSFPSGSTWSLLFLDTEDIGGLNKRQNKDEAKGSIIQLITSDQIRTVVTGTMLDEDVMCVIPDAMTLDRMSEFSILTQAPYRWAVAHQDVNGELVVDIVSESTSSEPLRATYQQACAIAQGDMSLRDALGSEAWARFSGENVDREHASSTDTASIAVVPDETPELNDSSSSFIDPDEHQVEFAPHDNGDDAIDDNLEDEIEGLGDVVDPDTPIDADDAPADHTIDASDVRHDDDNDIEDVPVDSSDIDMSDDIDGDDSHETVLADSEELRSAIARRYLSEDLDIAVDLSEFLTTFSVGAPTVQIAVPEGASEWLGDQIHQLARQANADLALIRQHHEQLLQTTFVSLMSNHAEEVIRSVAPDREGSRYKALADEIHKRHEAKVAGKEQTIRERKAEIKQAFDKEINEVRQRAANDAEARHRVRHKAKVEREYLTAVTEIDKQIENELASDQQELLKIRRQDAELRLQVGATKIFDVLSEHQEKMQKAEKEALDTWTKKCEELADTYRKADITQVQVLEEHNRTSTELETIKRQHADELRALEQTHADHMARMETEMDRVRTESATQLREKDAEWSHTIELEKAKTDAEMRQSVELRERIATIEEDVKRRYESRIAEMETDRQAQAHDLARLESMQSRSSKMLIVMIVSLALLCGVAGIIFGMGLG